MPKKFPFTATPRYTGNKMAGWYLELDAGVHTAMGLPVHSRVILYLNGEPYHRALRWSKNGYNQITLNGQMVKRHRLEDGQLIQVELSADESEFGMDFPEEFREVMNQDPEGRELFMRLTPGLQRGFLHYVSSAKSEEVRIKRSFHLMQRVRELNAG